ncbi:MAG TPA: CBS domain-containing protein, partial [Verrucomicrobiae bacterium]|nr:CBS domain-containing protein [Verrucomicrobiae bacterium]
KSQELLSLMESDDADDVRELMKYAEGTAGSLMTTEYIGLSTWLTAEQAINKLRELAPTAETIYYLFVVDDEESLMGVLSLRELIIAAPDTPLSQLMRTNIIKVNPYDDLERVAELVNKYGLLALPVADANNTLLGIITVDDILEILIPERGRLDVHSRLILHKRHA